MVPNTPSAVVSSPSRVSARHLPFGAWADRFSHVRSISAFTRVLNRTSCLSDRGLLVALVHEDQDDGREQDEGGDVEGAREAGYADEEAEGEGAEGGAGGGGGAHARAPARRRGGGGRGCGGRAGGGFRRRGSRGRRRRRRSRRRRRRSTGCCRGRARR